MIDVIEFNKKLYPAWQKYGFAAKFAFPFASLVCEGKGYDIGCNKIDWSFPGSIPIDLNINDEFHAMNLPAGDVDYIFSSHCLEHIPEWMKALTYWAAHLKRNGVLFLYLPDYSQEYWRPWNCAKHKNIFTPEIMRDAFRSLGLKNVFASGIDLNNSFMVMGERS